MPGRIIGCRRPAPAPPQLDEFYSLLEAPLRAAEFAALGFSEGDLWLEDAAPL